MSTVALGMKKKKTISHNPLWVQGSIFVFRSTGNKNKWHKQLQRRYLWKSSIWTCQFSVRPREGRSGRSGCHSKSSISPCQLQPLDVRSRRTSSSLQRSWIWQVQARLTKVVWLFPRHQTCSTVPVVVLEGCERQPSETNIRQCSYPRNRPASDWHLRYV